MTTIEDFFTLRYGLFEIKREGNKTKNDIRLIQATHLSTYPYLFSNARIDRRIVPVRKMIDGIEKGNVLLGAIRSPHEHAVSPVSLVSEDMPDAYPSHTIIIFQLKKETDPRLPYLLFWQLKYKNLLLKSYKGLKNKGSLAIKILNKLPLPYADNPEIIDQVMITSEKLAKLQREEENLIKNIETNFTY